MGIENSNSQDVDIITNNHKKPHRSPREKAFSETLEMITAMQSAWKTDSEGLGEDAMAETNAVNDALSKLAEQITSVKDAGAPKPQAKKSYRIVAVAADGTRTGLDLPELNFDIIESLKNKYKSAFGMYHSSATRDLVVQSGPRASDNRLF
jgi:hypothetical protein